jgi:hypothetical protein
MSAARYAIFYAPAPDSDLWRFGSSVIGYDAATGHDVAQFIPAGFDADAWNALTEAPRHYGFHATLKAPFRLAAGETETTLTTALTRFAASCVPFDAVLGVASIDAFAALTPGVPSAELVALERDIVETFDRFRAPLNEIEMAKRLAAPLTPRQRAHLARLGYPYVLEEFRFHMTLTGPIPETLQPTVLAALQAEFAKQAQPRSRIDRIALFREDGGKFRIVSHHTFAG